MENICYSILSFSLVLQWLLFNQFGAMVAIFLLPSVAAVCSADNLFACFEQFMLQPAATYMSTESLKGAPTTFCADRFLFMLF